MTYNFSGIFNSMRKMPNFVHETFYIHIFYVKNKNAISCMKWLFFQQKRIPLKNETCMQYCKKITYLILEL